MSWGDDPDLQDNVTLLRRLVEQLEVGVLWDMHDRLDARILVDKLCAQSAGRSRCAAVPPADTEEQKRSGNRKQGG